MLSIFDQLSNFHGSPGQHWPFVPKPQFVAEVSEFLAFPPTEAKQAQVTSRFQVELYLASSKIVMVCMFCINIWHAAFSLIGHNQNHLGGLNIESIFDMHLRVARCIPDIPLPSTLTPHT